MNAENIWALITIALVVSSVVALIVVPPLLERRKRQLFARVSWEITKGLRDIDIVPDGWRPVVPGRDIPWDHERHGL